jgi:hypothetical protein
MIKPCHNKECLRYGGEFSSKCKDYMRAMSRHCASYLTEHAKKVKDLTDELAIKDRALELATEEEAIALNANCPLPDDECTHCNGQVNSCHKVVQLNHIDVATKETII